MDHPTCVLFAGHSRAVDLIQKAAATAADPGAAAGDKDQAPDERRASHPVDRDRHVLEVRPFIGARVVDVVIGEDSVLLFAAPDMKAAARHDAVDQDVEHDVEHDVGDPEQKGGTRIATRTHLTVKA